MNLIFKSLWPELRVYSKQLILVFTLGLVISGLKGITPELIGRLPNAWEAKDYSAAIRIPIFISASWIVASVARYYHLYWMVYLSDLVAVNLRRRLMNKYLSLNLGFFQNFVSGSGGLLSRMINDINVIQGGTSKLADIVREPFMVVFTFGYLVWLDWRLVLFLVAGMPIVTGVIRRFARSLRKYARHNQESMEDLTQTIKESLDGTRIVQSFNLQDEMRRRFEVQAENYLSSRRKIISREEASGPVSESMAALFIAAVMIYIGNRAIHGHFSLGNFLSFSFAIGLLQDSTRKVQDAFIRLQQSAVALERLNSILANTNVVPEIASPKMFPTDWKEIEFRNVTFRYDHHIVLNNVNLTIGRGERVALVGSSGAGKSTLINLLPRFFDPVNGKILIGGIPIDEMNLHELRRHVALVSQDVFLFSDTVERNIWSGDFGKPAEGVTPASKLANADHFITHNPDGYKARVGERGSLFSGGEKQRISIARAIFKDAPILILDEATSALDSESELEVQKGLDHLLEGRTALIIAHRLSTIASCDRIVVLEKGQIVEQGSHEILMARQGPYFRFSQLQSRI
jgi:ATP-binding cassette subfamily B protein/subfamily B ATP-binding cassette protein MsbA